MPRRSRHRVRLIRVKLTIPGFDGHPLQVVTELPADTVQGYNWAESILTLLLYAKRGHDDKKLAASTDEDDAENDDAPEDECTICGKQKKPPDHIPW